MAFFDKGNAGLNHSLLGVTAGTLCFCNEGVIQTRCCLSMDSTL